MTEPQAALIDSNIVIDIIGEDPDWKTWSVGALAKCHDAFVNPLIFTELCYLMPSPASVSKILGQLEIRFQETSKEGLFLAAQAYKLYRKRGGTKSAPLADFFIGAHAAAEGVAIITRDEARYRTYFPSVQLICP